MMKNKSQYLLILFFIILISVPSYWLLRDQDSSQISLVEGRVLGLPENNYPTLKIAVDYIKQGKPDLALKLVWGLYTEGTLPKKFDGAFTDQFPFRLNLIKFSKWVDRQIIRFSYLFTNDDVIPADMTSDIYIIRSKNALIRPPYELEESSFEVIDRRIENYKRLVEEYPEINFYIYYLETLPFSEHHPLNVYFSNSDRGQSADYFKNNLPDQIKFASFDLKGINDHLSYFYRTDHHWNTIGILKAYDDIYNLLSENYTNMPDKLNPEEMITFPNIEFLGTFARYTLYPIEGDAFIGFKAGFADCKVFDQGVEGDYD